MQTQNTEFVLNNRKLEFPSIVGPRVTLAIPSPLLVAWLVTHSSAEYVVSVPGRLCLVIIYTCAKANIMHMYIAYFRSLALHNDE